MNTQLTKLSMLAAVGLALTTATPTAHAMGKGNTAAAKMEKKMRQVSGEIVNMKEVEIRGANIKNKIVMLNTTKKKRQLVVDLGPTTGLTAVKLNKGEKISVEGPVKQIRERRVLFADRIKVDGQEVKINRDEEKKKAEAEKK
jgi:hypothetical protein